jgi:hypothetical protein
MPYLDDRHYKTVVNYFVHDPKNTLPRPVALLP